MPLQNKYLRYRPEITLEIFTLVWDELVKHGFEPVHNLSSAWGEFSGKYPYFWCCSKNKPNQFMDNSENTTETTVQEILGYDPFVKDDFVLPEKWCVKFNKEVGVWLDKKTNNDFYYNSNFKYICYPEASYNSHIYEEIPEGYTEITFEQFQKYVLKTTEQPKVMEKDWSKATKEELMAEAKRRYPIGCTYSNAGNCGSVYEVENQSFSFIRPGVVYGEIDKGCLFYNYKWADIISLQETKVESKSIEKWSVGSYVVFLENQLQSNGKNIGDISKIVESNNELITFNDSTGNDIGGLNSVADKLKWFATLQEAEEFAKTLVEPVKEEVKFEVGKWYKIKTAYSWIIKYRDTINGQIKSDWYCESKPGTKVEKNGSWGSEPIEVKELSIEEIQQYLPDNHPDKIPLKTKDMVIDESCIGKFISFTYSNNFYDEALITKESGQIYLLNNCRSNNDGHKDKSIYKCSLCFSDFKGVNAVCNNIKFLDKPVEKQDNQEFKVGDWVIVLESDDYYHNCDKCPQEIKDIYYTYSIGYLLGFKNGSTNGYEKIRHATTEEIQQHLISIGEIVSVDTTAGLDCSAISSYDSIRMHYGGSVDTRTPRKISWTAVAEPTKDEVQLELMDIPKI